MNHPWRPAPTGWQRLAFRLPVTLYKLHLGWLLGKRFVLIQHLGRRSGLPRTTVVEVVTRTAGSLYVASGFGPRSDWYRNLRANPHAVLRQGRRHLTATAVLPPADERARVMAAYAAAHPRTARRLVEFMRLTHEESIDYDAVGRALPMVRFDLRSAPFDKSMP